MIKTLQGFKDFILRGNVIDLAVGIIIGAAFGTVVTALTDSFFTPLIRAVTGGSANVTGGQFHVHGQIVDYAKFLNAMITFVLTAAVLYFVIVLPMNTLAARRKRGEEAPSAAPSEEVLLLTEIRDALLRNNGAVPTQRVTTGATPAAAESAD